MIQHLNSKSNDFWIQILKDLVKNSNFEDNLGKLKKKIIQTLKKMTKNAYKLPQIMK